MAKLSAGGRNPMLKYRYNRATYWLFFALLLIASAILVYFGKDGVLTGVLFVILATPRLHDIGLSGWIAVGVVVLANALGIGVLLAGISSGHLETVIGVLGLAVFGLAALLGAIPGTAKTNRWGDPPAPGFNFRVSRGSRVSQDVFE
jgi:uncharacterized membrane protein YhaH (DUF805 family)